VGTHIWKRWRELLSKTEKEDLMSSEADYVAEKISSDFTIDGDIDKDVWRKAVWSSPFVDMVTGEPWIYETKIAMLWSDDYLYIAFSAEERFLEATLTERDSVIFLENDLELFIDGGDCYYELEINALNTVYEVFFIWRDSYERNGKFDIPAFDVFQKDVYIFAGDYDRSASSFWRGTHPRGARWAFTGFDMAGLETAVKLDGSLNDNSDSDNGWALEIRIPWRSLDILAGERSLPPTNGDVWRMMLGRFQKFVQNGVELQPHPATVLTPHDVYDAHMPDKWSRIKFQDGALRV
jgi:hypothetical protein